MDKNQSILLDFLRWFAAFLVVISHLRHLLFLDYKNVTDKTLLVKGFYFISGFGHEAVVIFFIISGFLVGGSSLRKIQQGGFSIGHYAIHRFSRIYMVLIPALLFGFIVDSLGLSFFNQSLLYTNSAQFQTISLNFVISNNLSLIVLIGNIFMLNGIIVPHFGSNAPLWSLAYEWWYYGLFGIFLSLVLSRNEGKIRILYFIILIALLAVLPLKILLWGILWMLGVTLIYAENIRFKPGPIGAGLVFLLILVGSRLSHSINNLEHHESLYIEFGRDLLVGFGCFLLVAAFSMNSSLKLPGAKIHKKLADFSYTIYLIHFPLLIFLVASAHDLVRIRFFKQPDINGGVLFCILLITIYVFGYMFSILTEARTSEVRKFLSNKFEQMRTPEKSS